MSLHPFNTRINKSEKSLFWRHQASLRGIEAFRVRVRVRVRIRVRVRVRPSFRFIDAFRRL